MQRNYYEVLRAMNDAPVEANGLYWFGVGIGQGAQLLFPQGIAGAANPPMSAHAYLIKTIGSSIQHQDIASRSEGYRLYEGGDSLMVFLTFWPDTSYEKAMTLIGEAVKALVNA